MNSQNCFQHRPTNTNVQKHISMRNSSKSISHYYDPIFPSKGIAQCQNPGPEDDTINTLVF